MKKKIILIVFCFLVLCSGIALALERGWIHLNSPSNEEYPIRGVDVSSYQGEIDWNVLSKEGIRFAYIKATEGSSHQDRRFTQNWENIRNTPLAAGAYHFFSFESSGLTQAENFIATVPLDSQSLPPAVDVEFYNGNEKNPPAKNLVRENLNLMLARLEEYYGKIPVLYVTQASYEQYIQGAYEEYPIWIRSVVGEPRLSDRENWTFWQYTSRMKLKGYEGKEEFIDMNVFCGSEEEFLSFIK